MGTLNLSNGVSLSGTGSVYSNSADSWGDAPAGTVIQVQTYQSATQGSGTSTSTSYVDDGVEVSITPLRSDSKLYFVCHSSSSIASGYGYFRVLETVSSTEWEIPWGNFSGSPQWLMEFSISGVYSPGNTTTRTFKLQGKCSAGTRYKNYNIKPNIVVMEIAV